MTVLAVAEAPAGNWLLVIAAAVIALAAWAIARGFDVRLVLLASALVLAALAGDVRPVVRKFLATLSDERFVVPICSAMGFAYVLKQTECDRNLVLLLMRPLRRTRLVLIPGVVLVGFLVNIPVISQTSTAVCLGPVVIPILRGAGVSMPTAGAALLLGSSLGGELLNPGAPELNTIAENQGRGPREVVPAISRLVFFHLLVATLVFWWRCGRSERGPPQLPATDDAPAPTRALNPARALVPLVPLIILFLSGPPLSWLEIPADWVVEPKARAVYATRLIGLAMLVGVAAAAIAVPQQLPGIPTAFFAGAGHAFATIISLIVTANCFGTAIEQIGLAAWLRQIVDAAPAALLPLAAGVPLAFAALSGSGMASTQSLYGIFAAAGAATRVDPIDLGAIVAIGAAAGRTMSPVAAVTLVCAAMTATSPLTLARRVAGPLLVSWTLVVLGRMVLG